MMISPSKKKMRLLLIRRSIADADCSSYYLIDELPSWISLVLNVRTYHTVLRITSSVD